VNLYEYFGRVEATINECAVFINVETSRLSDTFSCCCDFVIGQLLYSERNFLTLP